MNPILEQFLIEARENILFLDKNLGDLQNGDSETINALFRAAHTLKGSSGLAGFEAVNKVTHIAEDLLDAYRNKKIEFSNPLLEALYDMFDEVTELIDAAEESGDVVELNSSAIDEFESLRVNILTPTSSEEQSSEELVKSEFNIIDEDDFSSGSYFKNEFDSINIDKLDFSANKITVSSFEQMNYYIVELDLDQDTLELGNDPFYSIYLLGIENIISIYTEVDGKCEDILDDPTIFRSRVILLVESSKDILEDAFYNFMEDVTIYPLTIKSLFSSSLKPQSNDSIVDFIDDLKSILNNSNFDSIEKRLQSVLKIVNPNSLQGFLFTRLDYFIKNFEPNRDLVRDILILILERIGVEYDFTPTVETLPQDDSSKIESAPIEDVKDDLNIGETKDIESIKEAHKTPKIELSEALDSISDERKRVLLDILNQQKSILEFLKQDIVKEQVKSTLKRVQNSLEVDFNLDSLESKETISFLIDELILKVQSKLSIESNEDNEKSKEVKKETPTTTVSKDSIKTPTSSTTQSIQKSSITNTPNKSEPTKDEVVSKDNKKVSKQVTKTVKVDLSDIDSMMDIVGEMLVIKNSLPYIADAMSIDTIEANRRDLMARYDEINRVTTLLQEKVMQMRLLSLSFIFDRYPKLIRDISKSLGKKINYHEDGGDTKLDKTVIEKLADPLIHIIRNSLDHGIESKEDRLEKGKTPEGNISIFAKSIGDKVYVTIEDDGKGIDVEKVVNKALERRIVDPDSVDSMTHEEKLLLVFHAGLSTMEQISELSGRGVGMDVVRQTIDEVGGKISIESQKDIGTKITLELPMSVALTNVFHVKLGSVNYALSMDSISETVRVEAGEVEYINNYPMLKLRGSLIPLVFNYNLLSDGIKDSPTYSLLIVETQGTKFGFVVDAFVNQLDIVQKPLSSNFKNHPFISGTSLLGNGEVLFVINPAKLINLKEKK
jgi:two-component system chemotaxis sensor kinase CheA